MGQLWLVKLATVIVSAISLGGCSSGNKWITVVNESTGIHLTSRYVTSTKSIIVKSQSDGIKLILLLPDSVPRANRNKLGTQAKKYDFKGLFANKYNAWIKLVASSESETASNACTGISKQFKGSVANNLHVSAKFEQNKKGDISILVWEGWYDSNDDEQATVAVRARSGGAGVCISAWASDESLLKVVDWLMSMREGYINLLSEKEEGESYKMGSRLKRSTEQPIQPDGESVAENK